MQIAQRSESRHVVQFNTVVPSDKFFKRGVSRR